MTEKDETRGRQALLEIARVVTDTLTEAKIPAEQARELGLAAAEAVRSNYGGEQIYVPKGLALVLSSRDRQIWREFTGRNTLTLAKKYDLTERQVYSILSRVREEEFVARQRPLFG